MPIVMLDQHENQNSEEKKYLCVLFTNKLLIRTEAEKIIPTCNNNKEDPLLPESHSQFQQSIPSQNAIAVDSVINEPSLSSERIEKHFQESEKSEKIYKLLKLSKNLKNLQTVEAIEELKKSENNLQTAEAIKRHILVTIKRELEIEEDFVIVNGYCQINKHYDNFHKASTQLVKHKLLANNDFDHEKIEVEGLKRCQQQ
ncbi:15894_t:CDS:2 [Cetraspora pellucida]|uniref:15894_t:CDS:1 n=1 Tax=Cetraspora pellucida TaxID=1433469 RepID=A0A9N9BB32_9GLOM|nr:15894_t:CDS:2 [Cetraspora pellucida]